MFLHKQLTGYSKLIVPWYQHTKLFGLQLNFYKLKIFIIFIYRS